MKQSFSLPKDLFLPTLLIESSIPANNILLLNQEVKNPIRHPSINLEQFQTFILDQDTLLDGLPDQGLLDQHVLLEGDVKAAA